MRFAVLMRKQNMDTHGSPTAGFLRRCCLILGSSITIRVMQSQASSWGAIPRENLGYLLALT